MQRVLSTVTLLGLLVATAAAFAITEHLKLIKSPIYATSVSKLVSPVCRCPTAKAAIGFTLRHPDRLTVRIEDEARHTVATLATDVREPKGPVRFVWAPPVTVMSGTFQPEVYLARGRQTILMPNKIVVDTAPPTVVSASTGRGLLVPGGTRTIAISYVLGGKAHAIVYLGGRQIIRGRPTRERDAVKWNGRSHGRTLPPGRHVLEVGAVDLAGNVTPASGRQRVVVTIRVIALSETRLAVRRGARFSVRVAAETSSYTWRLGSRHGSARSGALRLRAPAKPGRYRLVVSARGHKDSALVVVGRK